MSYVTAPESSGPKPVGKQGRRRVTPPEVPYSMIASAIPVKINDGTWRCAFCAQTFANRAGARRHHPNHAPGQNFCKYGCGYSTPRKDKPLKTHELKCSPERAVAAIARDNAAAVRDLAALLASPRPRRQQSQQQSPRPPKPQQQRHILSQSGSGLLPPGGNASSTAIPTAAGNGGPSTLQSAALAPSWRVGVNVHEGAAKQAHHRGLGLAPTPGPTPAHHTPLQMLGAQTSGAIGLLHPQAGAPVPQSMASVPRKNHMRTPNVPFGLGLAHTICPTPPLSDLSEAQLTPTSASASWPASYGLLDGGAATMHHGPSLTDVHGALPDVSLYSDQVGLFTQPDEAGGDLDLFPGPDVAPTATPHGPGSTILHPGNLFDHGQVPIPTGMEEITGSPDLFSSSAVPIPGATQSGTGPATDPGFLTDGLWNPLPPGYGPSAALTSTTLDFGLDLGPDTGPDLPPTPPVTDWAVADDFLTPEQWALLSNYSPQVPSTMTDGPATDPPVPLEPTSSSPTGVDGSVPATWEQEQPEMQMQMEMPQRDFWELMGLLQT